MKKQIYIYLISVLFLFASCSSENKNEHNIQHNNSPSEKKSTQVDSSLITCPKCNFSKKEKLPDEFCLIKYQCENCKAELTPKEEDCCVFCSYGEVKCPSMQE